jgi:hypothetical protein
MKTISSERCIPKKKLWYTPISLTMKLFEKSRICDSCKVRVAARIETYTRHLPTREFWRAGLQNFYFTGCKFLIPGATLLFIGNFVYNIHKWQHKIFSRYKRLGLTVVCCEPQGILTFTSFEFMNSCTAYRHNETCEVGDLCKGVIRFCMKPQKSLLFCSKQFFL